MSEQELEAKLLFEGMKMGATPSSYKATLNPLIIASGHNSAKPHAEVSRRKLASGDVIIVDLTLRYNCYVADATRTFVVGQTSSKVKKLYNIVRASQEAGINVVKEGVSCGTIDNICRTYMNREDNYSKYFVHSTGHGIGLDVHEKPWIRKNSKERLQSNMVITIEPGIYLRGNFGIRIEDSLIVKRRSAKKREEEFDVSNLNKFTKDMLEIG
jgi:Xaa-Pro aminopeptidase/Xaa-Pro dipeptidase